MVEYLQEGEALREFWSVEKAFCLRAVDKGSAQMIIMRWFRYSMVAILAMAAFVGCIRDRGGSAESVQHGRLRVVPAKGAVTILDREAPEKWRTVERSHVAYRIFDVFDVAGRRSDNVWVESGFVFDWNQYKSIVLADGKALVVREGFRPGKPLANLWPEFFVSGKDGELPEASTEARNPFPVVFSHLLYLFEPPAVLWADYDAQGILARIGAAEQSGGIYFHASLAKKWGTVNPLAAYQIPARLDARNGVPPINAILTNGLAAITSSKFPAGRLVGCFVLNRSTRLDVVELRSFNPTGQPVGATLLRYRPRPYDKEIAEAYLRETPASVAQP